MPVIDKYRTNLFGETLVQFEYYPVLLPDDAGIMEIAILNQRLIEHRVKPSGITKLPQVSINGVICHENDIKIKT